MKIAILFFLIILFSLFQSTFLSLNLLLLLIISLAVYLPVKSGLIVVFGMGFLADLISGGSLGLTSLCFLSIVMLINLYRSRFHPDQLRFLLPFTFLSIILSHLVGGQVIEWGRILINTSMIVIFLPFLRPAREWPL